MSNDRWRLLKGALETALNHEPVSRFDAARRVCANRPSLEAEAVRLVRALDRTANLDISEPPSPEAPSFEHGDVLASRFRIIRLLGMGGMGEVYEAEEPGLSDHVALKTVRAGMRWSPQFERRFLREVDLARKVTHPNVCRIHDLYHHLTHDRATGAEQRIPFLTMELLRGDTLSAYLVRKGVLNPAEALDILRQLTAALMAAHAQGVVHRDLKSANIFLTPARNGFRAVVTDFGLAGLLETRHSSSADPDIVNSAYPLGGTPGYAAPEQLRGGDVTAAADIYSLGIVACEMVTGELQPGRSLADLPARWRRAIARCLDDEPSRRFGSAQEFLTALDPASAAVTSPAGYTRRALVGMGALAAAGVSAAVLWHPNGSKRRSISSIAVLAFAAKAGANRENDADEALFNGFTGELIRTLLSSKRLRVSSQYSASKYKAPYDFKTIASELHADALVTGVIDDNALEVKLIGSDAATIWRQKFPRRGSSDYDLHRLVQSSVVAQLVQTGTEFAVRKPYEPKTGAYNSYLIGRFFWARRQQNDVADARRMFLSAIEQDPGYAAAWAGLADTLQFDGNMTQARDAARKSLSLDPNCADAHLAMGIIFQRADWNWAEAEASFRRALDLEPSNSRAHHWYAGFLSDMGRFRASIREFQIAIELDPSSLPVNIAFGIGLFCAREFDQAIRQLEHSRTLDARSYRLYPFLGACWLYKGDKAKALEFYREAETILAGRDMRRDPTMSSHYIFCLAQTGYRQEALTRLQEFESEPGAENHPFYLALAWNAFGNRARALSLLRKAVAEHDPETTLLKVHPYCDSLRAEPEYQALLKRMKLA